jgi:hypothetical protein
MATDYQLELSPGDPLLRLVVRAQGLPQAGMPLDRQRFKVEPDKMDQLRGGDAPPALVIEVADKVSKWVLGNDLGLLLVQAFGQPNSSVRLIFNVDERLRSDLADVPVELTVPAGGGTPLALHPQVTAIVHLLPKVGIPLTPLAADAWPFRVLLVRSNPADLGGAVPAALPLRAQILAAAPGLGPGLVQVDVLSREAGPGVVGDPTPAVFKEQLTRIAYNLLIYLGHGDVLQTHQGLSPVGVLQFENDDGSAHESVPADQLAVLLHNRPVPVVVLAGCLTAGQLPQEIRAEVPQWIRGSQGVAQALVNSESGVQFAVGMRYRIDNQEAVKFLHAFFQSLLQDQPGNVEAAVRAARGDLHFLRPYSASWSAPMVFSTLRGEPLFPFLATPPAPASPILELEPYQRTREIFWRTLSGLAWSRRQPEFVDSLKQGLVAVEQQLVQIVLARAALLMPAWAEAQAGQMVHLPVELYRPVQADVLEGRLVVDGDISIQGVQPTQALLGSGYQLLAGAGGKQVKFRIQRDIPGQGVLPAGALFTATLVPGSASPVLYPVSVDSLQMQPQRPVCPGNNVVIVPPP